jgi:hypothetical protein
MEIMQSFIHLEINVHQDGTVRVYGNGGMIFQAIGDNIKMNTALFPVKPLNSGEIPKKVQK